MRQQQPTAEPPDRQLGFLWLGVATALVVLSPLAPHFAARLAACPFKTLTGVPCPGCGTTRAALALARFDFAEAFLRYPLPALAWTFLIVGGAVTGFLAWRRRPLPRLRHLPGWARAAIVAAVLANWTWSILTGV